MPSPTLPAASALARFSLAAQHPASLAWCSEAVRLANLADEHAFDLQLATDLELAAVRAERMNPAQPPEAFLNQWLPVLPGLEAMLSIRFEGANPSKPFVDASVTSRPVVHADLPALATLAQRTYAGFDPQRLRFRSAAQAGTFAGTQPDLRVLAAPLADLQHRLTPLELSLRPTLGTSQLEAAREAYADVDRLYPDHPDQARILSEEDLLENIEAGTMFDVLWNGGWAGYVGVLPKSEHGLNAYTVQELILSPACRGRGYGAALTTFLAQAVPEPDRVLLGTIHAENRGARQAALQAGRIDIGGWSWWSLL
ncbi:GNAT family N-acetyltransferase [Deinococcus oregonensis]|uniref:GNAT family N-acetyltransferase n=1 Tax=Deinococcus oregonensis TaxID=1805970 RepID=A0ABV6AYA2_9DEIO